MKNFTNIRDWYSGKLVTYCTNDYGEGLFSYDEKWGTYNQVTGTCQFSVRNVKHPSDKIRRFLKF